MTGTSLLQYWSGSAWSSISGGGGSVAVIPTITGFTVGVNYELIYVNSSNVIVGSATSGGYTIVRFYPTTTTTGAINLNNSVAITYLVGGGGGGGAGSISGTSNGGGGGAGGFLYSVDNMTASTSYSLQVGGGGAGA